MEKTVNKRFWGIWITACVFLFGCRLFTPATVQPPTPSPQPPSLGSQELSAAPAAVLTRVQGDVRLQQAAASQVVQASFGDYLWQGDVIMTGQEAQAEAVCSDGIAIQVDPDQEATVTCGETPDPTYQRVILHTHGGQIETLPATRLAPPAYGDLPVIWRPRNTRIAHQRPTIRWAAVEHATGYKVVVRSPGGDLWQVTTEDTELPYPETQPALEHGNSYIVQVIAQLGLVEQPRPSEEVLVTVLPAADVERVHQVEAQVGSLGLSRESARLFLSTYYVDMQLYDRAIRELVPLCEEAPSPLAHRLLGDAYLAVELDEKAAQSYREAGTLAREQGSRLIQAEAEVGLGHVAYAASHFEAALGHYQTALELYRELELKEAAGVLSQLADSTEALIPTPTP
jgi:hypothetical protein